MSEPLILTDQPQPAVTVLTLNRPERRNALNIPLMETLCGMLDELAADAAQRVVILRGAGPVFCAGLDLREAADLETAEHSSEWVARTLRTVTQSPLVTIAAAHGAAFAGGGGLMAACDFTVAADDLRIGFPEVRRGLVPALVSTVLRRKLRDADLRELFLLAEPIDALRAHQIGLIHRVLSADQVLDEALRLAATILTGAPQAVRQTKRLLAELSGSDDGFTQALRFHRDARASTEAQEGLAAFLEKRKPQWP